MIKRIALLILCILVSPCLYAQWQPTNGLTADTVFCFGFKSGSFFAGTNHGVFRSTDDGTNWTQVNSGLIDTSVHTLMLGGSDVFAGTVSGIFRSTNDGDNWTSLGGWVIAGGWVSSLVTVGDTIFASTYHAGLHFSTDNGASWNPWSSFPNPNISDLALIGTNFLASTWGGAGIYWSPDTGATWNPASGLGSNKETQAVGGIPALIFGITNSGVYRSTDNGANWVYSNLADSAMTSIIVTGSTVLIGSAWGVRRSTDGGDTWSFINDGLPSARVSALGFNANDAYAAMVGGGMYKRAISQIVNSVTLISPVVPEEFSLDQNFPNPFNPTTEIQFTIHHSQFTSLKIFDVLGREVSTLVNETLKPGSYRVTWDATEFPSGTYFYTLTAGGFIETKKILLLR